MSKQWVVCSGRGATYRGAFETLQEAFAFVAANIVRPKRENGTVGFRAEMTGSGEIDHYVWDAPSRDMDRADGEAQVNKPGAFPGFTDRQKKKIVADWLRVGVKCDDLDRANELYDFPNGFVPCVSVSTVKFERDYLARAAILNDNRDRRQQFAELTA